MCVFLCTYDSMWFKKAPKAQTGTLPTRLIGGHN
jgi:hypothetical protein